MPTTSEVELYAVGLVCASACAPADMSGEDVARAANQIHPTGVTPWHVSEDKTFANGDPNLRQCNTDPGRKHWLLNC